MISGLLFQPAIRKQKVQDLARPKQDHPLAFEELTVWCHRSTRQPQQLQPQPGRSQEAFSRPFSRQQSQREPRGHPREHQPRRLSHQQHLPANPQHLPPGRQQAQL